MFSAILQVPGFIWTLLMEGQVSLFNPTHYEGKTYTLAPPVPSVTLQLEPHSPGRAGFPFPSYTPQRKSPQTNTHTDRDCWAMGLPLRSQHIVPGCTWTLLMEGQVSLFHRTPTKTLESHCQSQGIV